jgi:hypothetical protein
MNWHNTNIKLIYSQPLYYLPLHKNPVIKTLREEVIVLTNLVCYANNIIPNIVQFPASVNEVTLMKERHISYIYSIIHIYEYLLTYLLHGAESFLKS